MTIPSKAVEKYPVWKIYLDFVLDTYRSERDYLATLASNFFLSYALIVAICSLPYS